MSSSLQHPFASSRYARTSVSTERLSRWLRTDRHAAGNASESVLALSDPQTNVVSPGPSSPETVGATAPRSLAGCKTPAITSSFTGHYVKHSSKVTLVLTGQDVRSKMPVYTSGSTIDGILAVARPSGLLGLEVVVEGKMKLSESAGSGTVEREIIKESLFTWDAERNASFPSRVSICYTLPAYYRPSGSEDRYRLPPTYEAHLKGMPGFKVSISYAIVVRVCRTREKSDWWRKSTSVRVPFEYAELSRPSLEGPFKPNLLTVPNTPKTLFNYVLRSKEARPYDLGVSLFLPNSQVCSLSEPIPFCITLTGDQENLAPFAALRPWPESFLPLHSSQPPSPTSLHQQLLTRGLFLSFPAEVQLQRQTRVDVMKSTVPHVREETHISASGVVAKGKIQSSSRCGSSLVWSGNIVVPPNITCGGFASRGIDVSDRLVLTITKPFGSLARYVEFCQIIPIRLTTETHNVYSATFIVSSDWQPA